MDLITSRTNVKVKFVRALQKTKGRKKSGRFLVEGIHHVAEAVSAANQSQERLEDTPLVTVDSIFYSPELLTSDFARNMIAEQIERGSACYATNADVFRSMAGRQNPQGLLAVVKATSMNLDDLDGSFFKWGVALAAPQDPGNVGTILRTIDAVGADSLILLDGGVDAYHPKAVRASMGAVFWHPVVSADFQKFVEWAGRVGVHIYGTSANAGLNYVSVEEYKQPMVLLMGGEREGLQINQKQICEQLLGIPMKGHVTSLNLGVATSLLLYSIAEKLKIFDT